MTISGVGPIVSLAFTATIDIQRLISGNQTLRYFQQPHILLGAPSFVNQRTEAGKIRDEIALCRSERDPPAVKTIERHLSRISKGK